jgi:predicted signal transduction protein with EAL and GGDEF domain
MDIANTILDAVSVGVFVIDRSDVVLVWNEFMQAHSGIAASDAIGKSVYEIFPDLPRAWMEKKIQAVFKLGHFAFSNWTERPFLFPLTPARIVTTGMTRMYQDCMFIPIRGEAGGIDAVCVTIVDASDAAMSHRELEHEAQQLKEVKDEILHLANHDPLTELPNRRFLNRYLSRLLHSGLETKNPFAILSIDLDGFKKINDTLGHPVGDEVLTIIAKRLLEAVRSTDCVVRRTDVPDDVADHTIARVGGDEFTLVLPSLRYPEDAAIVAKRIIEQCSQPIPVRGKTAYLGASVGIALFPNDGEDVVSLVKNADTALYHSKARGKGNHQFYSARMNEQSSERFWLESALHSAHDNRELLPYFQPQVDLLNHRVVGAEALMRWPHPDRGFIGPDKFIPIAEENGLITSIGKSLLRDVCFQAVKWRDAGFDLQLSVNVSPIELSQDSYVDGLAAILEETAMSPRQLVLEVTERVLLQDRPEFRERLLRLKALGVSLALDDFGTGFSSLNSLVHFPFDCIKIDRSFVAGMPQTCASTTIAGAMINLARSLEIEVVAEGVETSEQADLLAALGCRIAQGYLFSRPLPAQDVEGWLARRFMKAAG